MDFLGAFISGILSMIAYFIISLGVYKLYYIAKDIHEIKDLMAGALKNSPVSTPPARGVVPAATPKVTKDLSAEESATAYAQSLLRAVNAESPSPASETHEVR